MSSCNPQRKWYVHDPDVYVTRCRARLCNEDHELRVTTRTNVTEGFILSSLASLLCLSPECLLRPEAPADVWPIFQRNSDSPNQSPIGITGIMYDISITGSLQDVLIYINASKTTEAPDSYPHSVPCTLPSSIQYQTLLLQDILIYHVLHDALNRYLTSPISPFSLFSPYRCISSEISHPLLVPVTTGVLPLWTFAPMIVINFDFLSRPGHGSLTCTSNPVSCTFYITCTSW